QEGGARRSVSAVGRSPDGPAVSPDRAGEPGPLPEVFPDLLTLSGPGARALWTTRPDFPRQQPTPQSNPASPFRPPAPPGGWPSFFPLTRSALATGSRQSAKPGRRLFCLIRGPEKSVHQAHSVVIRVVEDPRKRASPSVTSAPGWGQGTLPPARS